MTSFRIKTYTQRASLIYVMKILQLDLMPNQPLIDIDITLLMKTEILAKQPSYT
jgi:hypothetical protein